MALKVNEDNFWAVKFFQWNKNTVFSNAVVLWQQQKPNK